MLNNVEETTLKFDRCIGCGICYSSCPVDAIKMEYTDLKEYKPKIDEDICINCGICTDYCPHSKEKIEIELNKLKEYGKPYEWGLENSDYFISWEKNDGNRVRSASGGFTTAFIKEMIENKYIDSVVHAEMVLGKIGEPHHRAVISRSIEDIEKRRSSFYGPINFDEIISEYKNKSERVLVIGVPCFIRAVSELFRNNEFYNRNKLYTVALACSHNVNGQFVDYLAESLEIEKSEEFYINLREKSGIRDANNFNNLFFSDKKEIKKENRFKTCFTQNWRSYAFAMNSCNYCSDFWGYTADISVKDAWGKWANEPLGKSMVIVRNKEVMDIISKMESINFEDLSYDELKYSQKDTVKFKHIDIFDRYYRNESNYRNIISTFILKKRLMTKSKTTYSNCDFNIAKKEIEKNIKLLDKVNKIKKIFLKIRSLK